MSDRVCYRIRLANLLAPVAGEANMGGPLGWIADSWIAGMLDVSDLINIITNSLLICFYKTSGFWV